MPWEFRFSEGEFGLDLGHCPGLQTGLVGGLSLRQPSSSHCSQLFSLSRGMTTACLWPPLCKESSRSSRKPLGRPRRSLGVCIHFLMHCHPTQVLFFRQAGAPENQASFVQCDGFLGAG